jgi:hypothetical protein
VSDALDGAEGWVLVLHHHVASPYLLVFKYSLPEISRMSPNVERDEELAGRKHVVDRLGRHASAIE